MISSTCKACILYRYVKRAPLHKLLTIGWKITAMKIYVFIQITSLSIEGDRMMKEKLKGNAPHAFFYSSIGVMDEFFGEPSSINHR